MKEKVDQKVSIKMLKDETNKINREKDSLLEFSQNWILLNFGINKTVIRKTFQKVWNKSIF